ncbi:MAG: glycosyltransferase [Mojavia pulchra JT2-VF2]|uniref:Glycosyltransferase n=1 Tax=Mojavia pulchra JT2-VF2 TaxID=287848 RepID=A0A951Q3Z3_9NOST|nr:glycosyltransferase [Mojavia pulchra JT2-VF2]
MWRRIKALSAQGVELQIIAWWFNNSPTPEEITEIHKYAQKVHLIQIKRTWNFQVKRVVDLLRYPLEVTSRIPKRNELKKLLLEVQKFNPDVIFLDGIHGGALANNLSELLHIPLVTRSHNIEHLYYRRMLSSATGLKNKLKRYLSVIHLEKYEKKLLKKSALFYDISADDLKFWQSQGFTNGRLLPPLMEFQDNQEENRVNQKNESKQSYDIVFLGNLSLENNVAGVVWFLTEVLPSIRIQMPQVTVLIAGLNPVSKIIQICEVSEGVFLSVNPPSANSIYKSGRVLINPILTGSGVKIKSIEMLKFGKPIVSTLEGVSGLPEAVKKYFSIAKDSQSFSLEVIKALSTSNNILTKHELLESIFGYKVIGKVVSEIKSILPK